MFQSSYICQHSEVTVYLLLGTNLGDREANLSRAIALLKAKAGRVEKVSRIYETAPWGMSEAGSFLNVALELTTQLETSELLRLVLQIEEQLGRERKPQVKEYVSRCIDIDILFYANAIIDSPQLVVPHPKMQLRKFVLVPLCEIASDMIHPVFQKRVSALLNECPDQLEVTVFKKKND